MRPCLIVVVFAAGCLAGCAEDPGVPQVEYSRGYSPPNPKHTFTVPDWEVGEPPQSFDIEQAVAALALMAFEGVIHVPSGGDGPRDVLVVLAQMDDSGRRTLGNFAVQNTLDHAGPRQYSPDGRNDYQPGTPDADGNLHYWLTLKAPRSGGSWRVRIYRHPAVEEPELLAESSLSVEEPTHPE